MGNRSVVSGDLPGMVIIRASKDSLGIFPVVVKWLKDLHICGARILGESL